ncbi:hypothetical protein BGY98DRAFT_1100562 [Russula aff. rugulosa BPL654]|nr:hypothetical protein BGY98DRAFT_1100562 [Russula aff. rugulosa BPL654]
MSTPPVPAKSSLARCSEDVTVVVRKRIPEERATTTAILWLLQKGWTSGGSLHGQVPRTSKRTKGSRTVEENTPEEEEDALYGEGSEESDQATVAATTLATLAELKEQQKVLSEKIAALEADF